MLTQNRMNCRKPKCIQALITGFAWVVVPLFISQSVLSQTPEVTFEQIKKIELEKIKTGAEVQVKIEDLDETRLNLASEYRVMLKQTSNLKKYNQQLRNTILSQQEEKQLLQQQIGRISHLERDIVPLMTDMLDALREFISLDTPFLYKERMERVRHLEGLLNNGNVSNSEKYRRILEAYQIENDYGRTIEAYDGPLMTANNGSSKQNVTFLKVGRLAYLYQTMDKKQVFYWSAFGKAWTALDSEYNARVDEGIKMAREQIPSNLLFIPVEAPGAI